MGLGGSRASPAAAAAVLDLSIAAKTSSTALVCGRSSRRRGAAGPAVDAGRDGTSGTLDALAAAAGATAVVVGRALVGVLPRARDTEPERARDAVTAAEEGATRAGAAGEGGGESSESRSGSTSMGSADVESATESMSMPSAGSLVMGTFRILLRNLSFL